MTQKFTEAFSIATRHIKRQSQFLTRAHRKAVGEIHEKFSGIRSR